MSKATDRAGAFFSIFCKRVVFSILIALMGVSENHQVRAQQSSDAVVMDDLVVTATRLPTPRQQLASSVTVITADDIERRQFRSLPQALRSVPGLHVVQSGGAGQQKLDGNGSI